MDFSGVGTENVPVSPLYARARGRMSLLSIPMVLILVDISSSLECSDQKAVDFDFKGRCIYTEFFTNGSVFDYKWAEAECRKRNTNQNVWSLPKLHDKFNHRFLAWHLQRMDKRSQGWTFWLGLMRDDAPPEIARNLTRWKNPEEWRWSIDNTSLDVYSAAHWNNDEPNNMAFISSNDPKKMERCVWAVVLPQPTEFWGDSECSGSGPTLFYNRTDTFTLVCESRLSRTTTSTVKTTTTSTTSATTSITPTTTTSTSTAIAIPSTQKESTRELKSSATNSFSKTTASKSSASTETEKPTDPTIPWHWWLLGSCIALFIICLAILIAVCCKVNRRRDGYKLREGRYWNMPEPENASLSNQSGSVKSKSTASWITAAYEKLRPAPWAKRAKKERKDRDKARPISRRK